MQRTHGLHLNKNKCESINTNPNRERIKFKNGTKVKNKNEAKYLGCHLTAKAESRKEINRRKGECTLIWRKLETFWKHSNCTEATKIHIYDAVIKSKLLYGLDSANLTQGMQDDLDTFQLKGLRQILHKDTTWAQIKHGQQPTNTNEEIWETAGKKLNEGRIERLAEYDLKHKENRLNITHYEDTELKPPKHLWKPTKIKKASERYIETRRELIGEVLRAHKSNPITACRNYPSLDLLEFPGKKRDGHPRDNWWTEGTEEYWEHITNVKYTYYKGQELNRKSTIHRVILETAARCRIGLKRDIDNSLTTKTRIDLGWINIKKRKQNPSKKRKAKTTKILNEKNWDPPE